MAGPPPPYPSHWEADAVLSDGGVVHIRPIVPDDADRMVALHARLSAGTIYMRFFSPRPRLSPREVQRFTVVDHEDRVALVALLGDDMIAVARYDRLPASDEAEVAFVVEDAQQGRGVGTLLLEHLAAAAQERGVVRFVAETLPENRRMQGVFRAAGWATTAKLADGVVRVEFDIEPTEAATASQQDREHRSEARSVARLLSPASIAVIGASRRPGHVGHDVFRHLLAGGFAGPVYPVNPSAPAVASVRAYASIEEVPDEVDLAVVAVPPSQLAAVVEECAAKRVGGLVVLSVSTGVEADVELVGRARRAGMRVIGPASMGVLNSDPAVSLVALAGGDAPPVGRIGLSAQSGALGIALLEGAAKAGVGLSSFVSTGNKSDVSGNDLLQYWEDDPATDVVMLYMETFGNPRKFTRVARRVARSKPVVAVKSGRRLPPTAMPNPGRRPDAGAGAPGDDVVDALFAQTGVIRVDTLEELYDTAALLAATPLPAGRRIGVVASTWGAGLLAVDACQGVGLTVGPFADDTLTALATVVPHLATATNPVDMAIVGTLDSYAEVVRLVLADAGIDAVHFVFTPPTQPWADDLGRRLAELSSDAGKPVVVTSLAAGPLGPLPVFRSPDAAAVAHARSVHYADWRRAPLGHVPELADVDTAAARLLVDAALAEAPDGMWLSLEDAVQLLAHMGVPVLPTATVFSADEAVAVADELMGSVAVVPPLVGEAGPAAAGLEGPDAVRAAFEVLVRAGTPAGAVAVQPLATEGVVVAVGVVQDPSFGPLLTLATAGPAGDLLDDRAYRITPLTDEDATDLAGSIRSAALLDASGGRPGLEELLLRVGRLVDDVPELVGLDLDPVVVSPTGAQVVAARARLEPWVPRPQLALRRMR